MPLFSRYTGETEVFLTFHILYENIFVTFVSTYDVSLCPKRKEP